MTPVLGKSYISVSINPENIRFLHFTNGGHTRKSIMAAPMFLSIERSILPSRKRRVINLKTIHRGKNQLVFFQALVLPSFNDNCFLK